MIIQQNLEDDYIEDEEVYPTEGEKIFFLGSTYHSVPCNNTDGRCALVGNVMYVDKL